MITVDLHTHTLCSHGKNSPEEMFAAGLERGLALQGFSEHSPRPSGYDYPKEYREQLTRLFPGYVRDVLALKERHPGRVLLGMEMDWFDAELPFIEKAVRAYPFDYLIGSVHFLGTWGFDADPRPWKTIPFAERARHYADYFATYARMAASGLFTIAAHPDLIKIFSAEDFARWLREEGGMDHARAALEAVKEAGMSLEISSAGLRKPCREIYPCPEIMTLAAELQVPVVFGSDAHQVSDVAFGFEELARYAASFGYAGGSCVIAGKRLDFSL